ncbi:hypothetical protein [Iodidimonas sp. SYSU 1G8]|uniref:hypothetical protein n=1 Tax=Iodidimonas sp. SYSU 1G8 TaxID=3133967 RepID=UPI0031FE6469
MAQEQAGEGRWFYFSMAVLSAAIIFAGFAPSYYLKNVFQAPPPLSPLTSLHGIVFTAWTLLSVLQTGLIAVNRPGLHRNLGILGAVLFGVVIAVGVTTAIVAGQLGHVPPGAPPPLVFMALPLVAMTGVTILVLIALANRSRPGVHKRLMLAGFFLMTAPALHRLSLGAGYVEAGTWVSLIGPDLLLLGAALYDLVSRRRIHPAYLCSALIYAALNVAVIWAFSSPSWLAFATRLVGGSS